MGELLRNRIGLFVVRYSHRNGRDWSKLVYKFTLRSAEKAARNHAAVGHARMAVLLWTLSDGWVHCSTFEPQWNKDGTRNPAWQG